MIDFRSVNVSSIVIAACAAYALGAIWYAPAVLGSAWLKALGKRKEDLGAPAKRLALQFGLTLATAAFLALLIVRFGAITWGEGAAIGLAVGIGFVATGAASDYLFCGWSIRLYGIQTAYRLASLALMGAILGTWR